MNEKETIEEMAKWLAELWIDYPPSAQEVAEALVKNNICKISDCSVILSKEEYEGKEITVEMSGGHKLKLTVGKFGEMSRVLEEFTRKETAKEFANIVYKAFTDKRVWNAKYNWWLQNGECFELKDLLKQILKQQFGVEVE